ncbi:MAG: hypothetical protein ABI867_33125 [Kofleriaceae bacterium]
MKLLVLVLAAAACGGPPAPKTPENAVATTAVELGEITVFDRGQAMLKFHADGTTEMGGRSGRARLVPGQSFSSDSLPVTWKAGPTVQSDGTVAFQGTPRVRINADGTITDLRNGTALPMAVTGDRVMVEPGKGLSLTADGFVTVIGGRPGMAIRVAGADTPAKRRLVLGFMGMMFLGKSTVTTTPGDETITTITTTTTDD